MATNDKKERKLSRDEHWMAGFLAGTGAILTAKASNGVTYVRLAMRSTARPEGIRRFAELAGGEARPITVKARGKTSEGYYFTLQGKPLHELMTRLWAELPKERKLEYAAARKAAKVANGEE